MHQLKPPAPLFLPAGTPSVFLAGSIEQGRAEDWQTRFAAGLGDLDVVVVNPRREHWDSSWRQSLDEPRFRGQVEWELQGLEGATVVAFHILADTRSPISLLELGLVAASGRAMVCCEEGFFRKGNVDVVCKRYSVPSVATFEELLALARKRLAGAAASS